MWHAEVVSLCRWYQWLYALDDILLKDNYLSRMNWKKCASQYVTSLPIVISRLMSWHFEYWLKWRFKHVISLIVMGMNNTGIWIQSYVQCHSIYIYTYIYIYVYIYVYIYIYIIVVWYIVIVTSAWENIKYIRFYTYSLPATIQIHNILDTSFRMGRAYSDYPLERRGAFSHSTKHQWR